MRQALVMKIAIARIYDPAAAASHVRLAIHRRKCGDITECANWTAINLGAMGLAAILDDTDSASVRLPDNVADIDRLANRMDHHDGAYIRGNTSHELLHADAVAPRHRVGETWHQTVEDDRGKRARVGDRRHDHLAAFRQTKCCDRDEQCSGPGGNRVRITAAHLLDEGV